MLGSRTRRSRYVKNALVVFLVFALPLSALLHEELRASVSYSELTYEVKITGSAFVPQNLVILKGDTVRWINMEPVSHTLLFTFISNGSSYLLSDPIPASTPYFPNATWTHTFNDTVELQYSSSNMPQISGFLTVRAPSSSGIRVLAVSPSTTTVYRHSNVPISVQVENTLAETRSLNVTVYANNAIVGLTVLTIPPSANNMCTVTWNTIGFNGEYVISARALDDILINGTVKVMGKGYFIIVAGNDYGNLLSAINYGCNQVYNILRKVGFERSRIYYLNQPEYYPQDVDGDGQNDISALATSANLQSAIETWARTRVTPTEPLFLYLFDHGGPDVFCIDSPDQVNSAQLASWLNSLEASTGASTYVIYAACHSGSFTPSLSETSRVIATSCRPEEFSYLPSGTWEAFSIPFWNQIKSGHSIESSFNAACSTVKQEGFQQTPQLDDDGDRVSHTGPLPNNGDGFLSEKVYIGACEWPYPWINSTIARQFFLTSNLPSSITVWTEVENKTALAHVTAYMLPPDYKPPPPSNNLVSPRLESFEMIDLNHDGNFTVEIPIVNFTKHYNGQPNAEFKFIITAEEQSGDVATPVVTSVVFNPTGQDTTPPSLFLERPLEGQSVHGVIALNGTVTDDSSLDRIEVYVEGNLSSTLSLPRTASSFFETTIDTTELSNGPSTIVVKAYDSSNNTSNTSVTVWVNNVVHDVAITNIAPAQTVIEQGLTVNVSLTLANHGSYAESINYTVYANSTVIKPTANITLAEGGSLTITFNWNTTDFAYGNYTLNAYAEPVPGETNTADNNFADGWITVAGVGTPAPIWPIMVAGVLGAILAAGIVMLYFLRKRKKQRKS
jgi:plastocyanin